MKKTIVSIFVSMFILASCNSGTSTSYEKGSVITEDQYNDLGKDKANNGKRVAIVGYAAAPSHDVYVSRDNMLTIPIYSKPNGEGSMLGNYSLKLKKDGKNTVYVPSTFTNENIRIYDNQGVELTTNDKVQVSFTVKMSDKERENKSLNPKTLKWDITKSYETHNEDIRLDKAM